jgi:hypothetical protein
MLCKVRKVDNDKDDDNDDDDDDDDNNNNNNNKGSSGMGEVAPLYGVDSTLVFQNHSENT